MSDLKPCPFCGATATPRRIVHYYEVECDSCDAAVAGENEADAVAKWNRRAPPKELVEAWERYQSDQAKAETYYAKSQAYSDNAAKIVTAVMELCDNKKETE